MGSSLTKDRLIFDPADLVESDQIGAFLRAGSDGDLLTSTLIGSKEALDVNLVGGADSGIFAEDDAHVSGDKGQFVLAVRNDASTSMVSDDGDYAPLQVDAQGRLLVAADISIVTGAEKAEDSAHASGDIGQYVLAVRQDSLSSSVSADGDYASFKLDSRGGLWSVPVGTVADDAADNERPVKVGSRAVSGALSAVQTGDRADLLSDLYRRVWINDSPNIAVASAEVAVGLTEVALPTSALAGRRRLTVQNLSNNDIYVGPTGVTTSGATKGLRVAKGSTLNLELGQNVTLYGIAGSAGNNVVVFEQA
jgi:hypothetical protein